MGQSQFTNRIQTLPSLKEEDCIDPLLFQALPTQFLIANTVARILTGSLLLLALMIINWQPFFTPPELLTNHFWIISSGISLVLISYISLGWYADSQKGYCLREQDISYQSGIFFKHIVTQPLLRIQHVELKRGPIERHFKLASLQVFSAGGAMYTFQIPGLKLKRAEFIRHSLIEHKKQPNQARQQFNKDNLLTEQSEGSVGGE